MAEEYVSDPGLGERYDKQTQRIINPDGSFNIYREGLGPAIRHLYQFFLNISWLKFISILLVAYLVTNVLFALSYMAVGVDGIQGYRTHKFGSDFLTALFFSFQTFTTVGYGGLAPVGISVNIIASFQALVGFMSFSIATGVLYGRFAQPHAIIMYSKNILLSPFKGGYSLMFRAVNMRNNVLMEMEAKLLLATTKEVNGEFRRTYSRLKLDISQIDFFPLNWTLVHPIDEESPFFEKSPAQIMKLNPEVLVLLKGFDDSFSQVVHSRFSYTKGDIVFNAKFLPAYKTYRDGSTHLNVRDIHLYEKIKGKIQIEAISEKE